jgi:hypothetical protein
MTRTSVRCPERSVLGNRLGKVVAQEFSFWGVDVNLPDPTRLHFA